jgi:hypothetical protein
MGPCDRWSSGCCGNSSSAAFSNTASLLPEWDATLLIGLFRERILARLLDRHAISPELVQKLVGWRHPGFSAHVGESIPPHESQRLEDTAAYLVRNPLSLRKLVYLDGQQAVLYRLCGALHKRY